MLLKRLTFNVLLIGKSVLIITNFFYPGSVGKGIVLNDVSYLWQDILKIIKLGIDQPYMRKSEKYQDNYHN